MMGETDMPPRVNTPDSVFENAGVAARQAADTGDDTRMGRAVDAAVDTAHRESTRLVYLHAARLALRHSRQPLADPGWERCLPVPSGTSRYERWPEICSAWPPRTQLPPTRR